MTGDVAGPVAVGHGGCSAGQRSVAHGGTPSVTADSAGTTTTSAVKSTESCRLTYKSTVPYTVDGAKSTGKFAGATGNGKTVIVVSADLPRLSNGSCNDSQNAEPSAKTAVGAFTATGTLTLNQ